MCVCVFHEIITYLNSVTFFSRCHVESIANDIIWNPLLKIITYITLF
jgi:hypothetical protein